jgi:hypothetical protein
MDDRRYTLLLVEVETGIVLDSRGNRCSGAVPFRPTFATREAAIAAKDDLLRAFPFAEVSLTDTVGEHDAELFSTTTAEGPAAPSQTWEGVGGGPQGLLRL